jgi:ribosome-associated protein
VIFVRPGVAIGEAELDIRYVRSSGPGGQNVNKTSTKAVVRWNVRSAPNLRDDVKARPGRAARERRILAKKSRGTTKSLRGRVDFD